jgi:hypothetical protein
MGSTVTRLILRDKLELDARKQPLNPLSFFSQLISSGPFHDQHVLKNNENTHIFAKDSEIRYCANIQGHSVSEGFPAKSERRKM